MHNIADKAENMAQSRLSNEMNMVLTTAKTVESLQAEFDEALVK